MGLIGEAIQEATQQGSFIAKARVDRTHGQARTRGDLRDRDVVEALVGDQFLGRIEQPFDISLTSRLAGRANPMQV
jgi:hypothetical protein